MQHELPAPPERLVEAQPGILDPAPVDVDRISGGVVRPHELRDGVGQRREGRLRGAALVDRDHRAVPGRHRAGGFEHRDRVRDHPAKLTVAVADAELLAKCNGRRHRAEPRVADAGCVVGVQDVRPAVVEHGLHRDAAEPLPRRVRERDRAVGARDVHDRRNVLEQRAEIDVGGSRQVANGAFLSSTRGA